MVVGVDETGHQRESGKVHFLSARRRLYRPPGPDARYAFAVQQDCGVLDHRPPGAVDEVSANQKFHIRSPASNLSIEFAGPSRSMLVKALFHVKEAK